MIDAKREINSLPMILGMGNNNFEVTIDFSKDTSGFILGKEESGKSELLKSLLISSMVQMNSSDLVIWLLDTRDNFEVLSWSPHVVQYVKESRYDDLLKLLDFLLDESERRSRTIIASGVSDWDSFKKSIEEINGNDTGLFPWIIVAIDSLGEIYHELFNNSDLSEIEINDIYDEINSKLEELIVKSKLLGIKFLVTSDKATSSHLPRYILTKSTLKICKSIESSIDYLNKIFGKSIIDLNNVEDLVFTSSDNKIPYIFKNTRVQSDEKTEKRLKMIDDNYSEFIIYNKLKDKELYNRDVILEGLKNKDQLAEIDRVRNGIDEYRK